MPKPRQRAKTPKIRIRGLKASKKSFRELLISLKGQKLAVLRTNNNWWEDCSILDVKSDYIILEAGYEMPVKLPIVHLEYIRERIPEIPAITYFRLT